jgi:hypothetical protein
MDNNHCPKKPLEPVLAPLSQLLPRTPVLFSEGFNLLSMILPE